MALIGGGFMATVLIAVIFIGAIVALLVSSLSPHSRWLARRGRHDHDVAIAQAQISELYSDREQGLIGEDEYQAARLEIERRLLVADQQNQPGRETLHHDHRQRFWTRIALVVLIPLAAGGLYLTLGAPGLPGLVYAERVQLLAEGRRVLAEGGEDLSLGQLDALIADLAVRLAAGDGDGDAWRFLARGYQSLASPLAARRALEEGLARFPDHDGLQADYAAMLIAVNSVAARLDQLFSVDGEVGFSLWRQGLVAAGLGQQEAAADYWQQLLAILPAEDGDRRQFLEKALTALRLSNDAVPGN